MFRCEHHDRIDSTSAQALRVWHGLSEDAAAPTGPLWVTATEQTAGVGRHGRRWHSPRGGVWLTIAWPVTRAADHYVAMPLAAGLAVAQTIESLVDLDVSIKWPNDLLVNHRKVCGILCQFDATQRPVVLVGIGLNANLPVRSLGDDLRYPATSLAAELGHDIDMTALRQRLYDRLGRTLQAYDTHGITDRLEPIRQRLAWVGHAVRCEELGGRVHAGTILGLDDRGRLLLDTPTGKQTLAAGELVRMRADRPLRGPSNTKTTECVR